MDITLTESPDGIMAKSLDALFDSSKILANPDWQEDMQSALENLAGLYVPKVSNFTPLDLEFDWHAMRRLIGRFHREVYGVAVLYRTLDEMAKQGGLDSTAANNIKDGISTLGIRINSPAPLMTRRVAAFSLWMATFRPVRLKWSVSKGDKRAPFFCAGLNFWIATNWLRRCGGTVNLGTKADYQKRLERVLHDFTYREINLSSLEFFYCGIFQTAEGKSEIAGPLDSFASELAGLVLPVHPAQ